jgi:2'-5' RNA ligase
MNTDSKHPGNAVPPEETWRMFMAVDLPEEVCGALMRVRDELKKTGADVGWVAADKMHLTLVFIGAGPARLVEGLSAGMTEAARAVDPFEFRVAGLGWFGTPAVPRVIWAGSPDPPPGLRELQRRCWEAAERLGVRPERRPFAPHLTLGRLRGRGAAALTAEAGKHQNESFGVAPARSVRLMRSIRVAGGARHTELSRADLGRRGLEAP